jgi:multisubunit Na+/H+ antiporter MnhE subunit
MNNSEISYGQITLGLILSFIAVGFSYYFDLIMLFWVSVTVILFYAAILWMSLTKNSRSKQSGNEELIKSE